jgi:hypothetical protein
VDPEVVVKRGGDLGACRSDGDTTVCIACGQVVLMKTSVFLA